MVTLTGKFVYEDNTPVANGILVLALSQPAAISGTGQVVPLVKVVQLDASGNIPGSTQVYGNDVLVPSGTSYVAALYTGALNAATGLYTTGAQLFNQNWSLTGSSVDVSTLTPSTVGVSYPNPITSVGLTMPGEFVVTGSPLTAAGTIAVTKANQNANLVFAGPTSGGAASPTFRGLVDADVPGSLSGAGALKNKNLTAASSGNTVGLLGMIGNSGALTGSGAAQNVFSFNLPANTMQAGKGIRLTVYVLQGGATNAAVMALNFGSRNFGLGTFSTTGLLTGQWKIEIFNKSGVTNAQIITATGFPGTAAFNSADTASAVDTTQPVTITITFNVANTTTITPVLFVVEQIQ